MPLSPPQFQPAPQLPVPAMTADYLVFHVRSRPQHIAVVDCGVSVTYQQFHDDLLRVIPAVSALAIPANAFVAVEWDGLYRHWLLLQACECLGIPTFSYASGSQSPVYETLISKAEVVLHVSPREPAAQRQVCVDPAWWDQVRGSVPVDRLPSPPPRTQALRIVCSSGTTAAAKVMAQTVGQIDFRQNNCLWHYGLSPDTRHLVGMGFMIQADYLRAIACLRAGGTVLFDDRKPVWDVLLECQPTHMALMPLHLSPILDNIGTGPQPKRFHVTAYGGGVPNGVRQRLLDTIASDFVEQYGTNEFSFISTVGADGVGALYPGVTVQIVDEQDQVQPFGTAGRIRVRSPGCVDGYLFEPASESGKFRDGWCYPGDIGVMDTPRSLRLQGREDDILNIRGIKIHAPEFEARFREIPGIRDVAVSDHPDDQGIPALCILVESQPGTDTDTLRQQLSEKLSVRLGTFYLVPVQGIPRTATGKIQRNKLRDALARLLA